MIYKEIPYVNNPVSRLFYGAGADPVSMGENCDELLDAIYKAGVNAFDTGRVYNLSENTLGKWIEKREIRNNVVILSKCAHPGEGGIKRLNRKDIEYDLQKSCEALRTPYIDIYLLHRDDPDIEAGCMVEIFNDLHSKGKIGAFGGSNWTHQRIEEANEYAYQHNMIPFTVSSPYFGLARQIEDPWGGGCVSISGNENKEARKWYEINQMPVIAYSSLGRGLFSGRIKGNESENAANIMDQFAMKGYGHEENFERLRRAEKIALRKGKKVSQIAMAWIYQQGLNTFAVVSTTNISRMEENIEALHISLTENEIRYLDLLCDICED